MTMRKQMTQQEILIHTTANQKMKGRLSQKCKPSPHIREQCCHFIAPSKIETKGACQIPLICLSSEFGSVASMAHSMFDPVVTNSNGKTGLRNFLFQKSGFQPRDAEMLQILFFEGFTWAMTGIPTVSTIVTEVSIHNDSR